VAVLIVGLLIHAHACIDPYLQAGLLI